jgi:quercetin dioxygenase-like cupin family protein
MSSQPIDLFDADASGWDVELVGADHGSGMSLILFRVEEVGVGPDPHTHPYEEVIVVRQGHARFTIEAEEFEVHAGQVVVAPAGVRHGFKNIGPGVLETVDIHAAGRFNTTWVD